MHDDFKFTEHPHKRLNILTNEWILVSPHRNKRPWQGNEHSSALSQREHYDAECYLCPGNKRSNGAINPDYTDTFSFTNDFPALVPGDVDDRFTTDNLLQAKNVNGICKVICFSPRHDLTLPELSIENIVLIIKLWQIEFTELSSYTWIKYIQIFENKGEIMGCSNPHPHGQIWAQSDLPSEIMKEDKTQSEYYKKHNKTLLQDYLQLELKQQERIVCENESFIVLVPFWAIWPYETMIISRRHIKSITEFNEKETAALADILKRLTTRYDNLFLTSFPYSAGMHQAPVNTDTDVSHWHWHLHFYPPLLRSATIKKFMVGYELLANPQRDITPEQAAKQLQSLSEQHYNLNNE
ncbi:MAG: UDP-glucose--hexose-1-phosphate uridylyltransferase [Bacteroidia bacterium]